RWWRGAPSKAKPCLATAAPPNIRAKLIRSDLRITHLLLCPARMRYGTADRRPHLLGVLPQSARRMFSLMRLPFGSALREVRFGQFYVKNSGHCVDLNDVAVL